MTNCGSIQKNVISKRGGGIEYKLFQDFKKLQFQKSFIIKTKNKNKNKNKKFGMNKKIWN